MSSDRTKLLPLLGCVLMLTACPGGGSSNDGPTDADADAGAAEELPDAGEPLDAGDDPDPKPKPPKPAADGGAHPEPNVPERPSSPSKPSMGGSAGAPAKPAPEPGETPSVPADLRPFFMPTTPEPRNTRFPRMLFDSRGGLHAAYPAAAGNGAFYAYCPDGCADPNQIEVVALPTDGIPSSALIALTPDGRPRVLVPTYLRLYYAECDANCSDESSWTTSAIVDHQSNLEVTGDAFAIDSQGRPHFVMHTYVAYLGVGQKEPHTYYAQCGADCTDPASWQVSDIQDQIWQYSTLRFDAADRPHLSTVVIDPASSVKQVAYVTCEGDCSTAEGWGGILLAPAFENNVAEIYPSVSLALTSTGGARVAALVMPEPGSRALAYFECDGLCSEDNWRVAVISNAYELGSGVDLEVDANDHPRLVFTLKYNIGLYHCEAADCTAETAEWNLEKVEFSSDLTPDTIILWPNCTGGSWMLHDPTLVLAADGSARVGYEASDVSGGWTTIDPTMTPCSAGKDMTLARVASLPSL